ncbi:exopolygalacturonase [Pseudomassariella vexata]|uniref:galacturonan 1,4-alpha-galacturonidase n=1 Tax=Pseudomassariella vexata TaxID=1141098 RepID=A0A1Y2DZU5_9PEZI|nr:exopolygalacturonase [Pseudomassariella vexata]ORY64810.1 exopolygalacturonase [Pseudomassariella vexata]
MRCSTLFVALSAAAGVLATAFGELPAGVPRNVHEFRLKHPYKSNGGGSDHADGQRPIVKIRPSRNATDGVADEFLKGLHKANHGGTLYLPKGELYIIDKPLDLTFLDDVQVHWDGEVKFTDDTPFWQANAFAHPFQNSLMFWKWGGKDIKLYGEGILNGNGQRWWNEFAGLEILDPDNEYLRPILFYAENATNLEMEGIHEKDSPCWTNFIVTSKGVSFTNVIVTAESNNASSLPKNTDFFDSLNVEDVTVERVWVNIGDDCFSPKSNATNIHVDTMYCNGTHGQSMGSVGQYAGEKSFIQDVVIENVWLLNGQHGARIKTWAGPDVGYGFVDNITFRNFWQAANEYAAFLDSCYFNIDASTCEQYPSQMNITNILFENFTGYTSGKYGTAVARLTCSANPDAVCDNITFKNFNITSPCGEAVIICDDIRGGIGVDCVPSNSTEATAALAATCTVPQATIAPPF